MRNMMIALTALAGIACGGPVADAEANADAVCACEDAKCVEDLKDDALNKEIEEFLKEASDEDKKAITAAGAKAADCVQKLAGK